MSQNQKIAEEWRRNQAKQSKTISFRKKVTETELEEHLEHRKSIFNLSILLLCFRFAPAPGHVETGTFSVVAEDVVEIFWSTHFAKPKVTIV